MPRNERPLRSVGEDPDAPVLARDTWPATLAPIGQLLDSGLELGPVTVFVGENGAGKSTLVEAIAGAYGMGPEGGSTGSRHTTRRSESALADHLRLSRGLGAGRGGFFLRAETMHGFFTYLEDNPGGSEPVFHERSHGESFLDLVAARSRYPGLWILDEPESALSFTGSLALLRNLQDILDAGGSQVILSTHSPILASLPGAVIYEVGPWGYRPCAWDDLDLVRDWRSFLEEPERYLRHLL
ncbi:AAA family ATPase [Cryobacterium cryoconiti]|uniref:ATP-binding cassette domain-containing protein n=1 Tax=Cryobacterium cryoconiti TaxID=1259239 RepID=A0A4Y8JXY6_9MICO|nr:AAA family ATPase [Cryobacterium cryoconiti]TFD31203.1 ATP-binding cassette domain-containing protein [Cryobacterium cryoconiti]